MDINKKRTQVFLVLVPHRDIRVELRKHSDTLIKNGLTGVYPFPLAAPLASLSKPLYANELKYITQTLRLTTAGEKINVIENSTTSFYKKNDNMALFGSRLDLDFSNLIIHRRFEYREQKDELSDSLSKKLKTIFAPIVIGSFLVPETHKLQVQDSSWFNNLNLPPPALLSFRAAAVANMFWQSVESKGEIFYKWKIDKLNWLPKAK
jgi:hypothetical protein